MAAAAISARGPRDRDCFVEEIRREEGPRECCGPLARAFSADAQPGPDPKKQKTSASASASAGVRPPQGPVCSVPLMAHWRVRACVCGRCGRWGRWGPPSPSDVPLFRASVAVQQSPWGRGRGVRQNANECLHLLCPPLSKDGVWVKTFGRALLMRAPLLSRRRCPWRCQ